MMRIVPRLREILEAHGAYNRGIIKRIAEFATTDPRQITALLNDKLRHIPMRTLSATCCFLVEELGIDPDEVSRSLFGFKADGLSSMLKHTHVDYCIGLRNLHETAEPRWVNAYDAMLQGAFLEGLFAIGHKHRTGLKQHLVRSYHPAGNQAWLAEQSSAYYANLGKRKGARALVCLGSVKSNPLSECVIAEAFDTKPFTPPRNTSRPSLCPFFLRYRDDDPHPPSCHAGRKTTGVCRDRGPGIYYETESGEWEFCPTDDLHDAAIVFYIHKPTERSAEMVLAGFSGLATGCMARDLSWLSRQLWPPQISQDDLMVGAFVVSYEFRTPPSAHIDFRYLVPKTQKHKVIPISPKVLASRLLLDWPPASDEAEEAESGQPVAPR
jgi:hypothetical protein